MVGKISPPPCAVCDLGFLSGISGQLQAVGSAVWGKGRGFLCTFNTLCGCWGFAVSQLRLWGGGRWMWLALWGGGR